MQLDAKDAASAASLDARHDESDEVENLMEDGRLSESSQVFVLDTLKCDLGDDRLRASAGQTQEGRALARRKRECSSKRN
jgi:hypothetical protein